ncbi:MAG: tRNA preQ1(34) S-adenosylmethionine ribosyltransferase-isomerase QueA [Bryobacteraceae bacterium]
MLVSEFDFELPPNLIAQTPPAERGSSRMLVVSREKQTFEDGLFSDFHKHVGPGDCVVLNNTRVFPARLRGRRNHVEGPEVEILLVQSRRPDETVWRALARPAKRARRGDMIFFDTCLKAVVIEEGEHGERTLEFQSPEPLATVFERIGSVPLPPYIRRKPEEFDRERYQTVFAEKRVSVAAPTAGLHFTEEMLELCRAEGAVIAYVTLHVGLGTFAPLRTSRVDEVQLHEEYFEIDNSSAAAIQASRRCVCVGTTSVRALETAMLRGGVRAMQGETNLFISPGFTFRAAGALLTNFHLPQSSLLILVSAFAGKDLILRAYRHAVEAQYRFFSYGDCMLVL